MTLLKTLYRIAPLLVGAALSFILGACASVSPQTSAAFSYVAPLADHPEQILLRTAYTTSYNRDTRQPNWVAWTLTAGHTDGNAKRPQNAWHDDHEVPEPRAYYYDYKGSGYDHGHMCPAGDCKWDANVMYESFLMTNCCPQNRNLNSGLWNQIEMSCRQWAKRYGEIVIVCGPIFFNSDHDTIGPHRIPVPEAFFKVIACLDPNNPIGIGFICRNTDGDRKKDLYTNTIAQVERITGFSFFPDLDPEMAAKIKNNDDMSAFGNERIR